MIDAGAALFKFYLPWLFALAIAADVPEVAVPGGLSLQLAGIDLPVVQLGLALAGVLMARPLAPRRSPPLGWFKGLLTTVIMLIIAAAWTVEARPGLLFAFVVAIGLGFSGYALIELAGREVEAFIKGIFAAATMAIGKLTGKDQ